MCLVNSNNDTVKKTSPTRMEKHDSKMHNRKWSPKFFSDVIAGNVVVSNTVEVEVFVEIEVESWIAEVVITTRFDRLIRTEDGVMFE